MGTCHDCKYSDQIQKGLWKDKPFEQTPCSRCRLSLDSLGTLEYRESDPANATWDANPDDDPWNPETADTKSHQPYAGLDGDNPDDPMVPLSALVSAMSLFLSLSLPARKCIQLRMQNLPYSAIAARIGCTRAAVEKQVSAAIATHPLLGNLLPGKSGRKAAS